MNNKLVIIGNGFDLSHGLNLSYEDFLLNYFHKCLYNLSVCEVKRDVENISHFYQLYTDELLTIETQKWTDCGTEENTIQNINNREWYHNLDISNIESIEKLIDKIKNGLKISFVNDFSLIEKILGLREKNWVDFESLYFDCLVEIKDDSDGKIESLNTQWDFLKSEFLIYLNSTQREIKSNWGDYNLFKNDVLKYLFDGYFVGEVDKPEFEKYYYLNFNFTYVLEELYQFSNIIPIHGKLEDDNSDVLFGYGNVGHIKYPDVKSQRNQLFRKNLKFNYYSNKTHKNKLSELIDKDSFDIKIIGHSCGESDRTLLEEMFNHPNCKSIKIYSRNKEGFERIRNNISMFKDFETSLSKKIIPFYNLSDNLIIQFNSKSSLINIEYKTS